MRYRLLALALVITFCFCLVYKSNAATVNNIPPDIQKILNRGTLIVALYNKDVPPFFMQDSSGKLTGYDITLAQDLAKHLGVKIEFHRMADTFDGVVDEIAKGHADIGISLISITLPRALKVNFSTPYVYLPQALLYNRLQAAQQNYTDPVSQIANNPTIVLGVLNKSAYVEYAQMTYPTAKLILYPNINQGMQDVRSGKIFGFYLNKIEIKNWLNQNPDANLYVNYELINNKKDPIGIAISWSDNHLLNWINWYLFTSEHNGTIEKLQNQYFVSK